MTDRSRNHKIYCSLRAIERELAYLYSIIREQSEPNNSESTYPPRGFERKRHPGLIGIETLRRDYYMSRAYVIEKCQKSGIHIEEILSHWYIRKEDKDLVIKVCNLEPKLINKGGENRRD